MDLEIIILSQSEKDKYHIISLMCGIHTHTHTHPHTQKETHIENEIYGHQRGKEGCGERDKLGGWY